MTGTNNGHAPPATETSLAPIVETVRLTVLDLIASLPERPERLRVQAAGVLVDLDWRGLAPAVVRPEPNGQDVVAAAVADRRDQVTGELTAESRPDAHFVCAPAVGTFYHAPEPGKPPFVEPGALVEAGQQVGIIEAMKLMLPVEADRAGRAVSVLVEDGRPVQYGERLIELGPVGSD